MESQQYDSSLEMERLSANLYRLLEINHLKVSKLSMNTGVSATNIYNILNVVSNPTIQTLLAIANFFDVTLEQLLGKKPLDANKSGYIENPTLWPSIPLLSWKDIRTYLTLSPTERKEKYNERQFQTDGELSDGAFALMMDEIAEWSLFPTATVLIIDPLSKPESKDYILVCKRGEEKPTLRVMIMDGSECYLKFPPMADMENKIVPVGNDWEILGVVQEITYRKGLIK